MLCQSWKSLFVLYDFVLYETSCKGTLTKNKKVPLTTRMLLKEENIT